MWWQAAKVSEAKLAAFKFEEVVYEAPALQKLTVVILKAIAERLSITLKSAKNKQEWITRILARASVNRPHAEDAANASEHPQGEAVASASDRPQGQAVSSVVASANQSPSASDRPQGQAVSSAVASANQSPNAQAGRQEQRHG
jgi:hypothetical protein